MHCKRWGRLAQYVRLIDETAASIGNRTAELTSAVTEDVSPAPIVTLDKLAKEISSTVEDDSHAAEKSLEEDDSHISDMTSLRVVGDDDSHHVTDVTSALSADRPEEMSSYQDAAIECVGEAAATAEQKVASTDQEVDAKNQVKNYAF